MRKRNWACPECAEECEPEWPKVIDELQAEVQKLKGKVAELRAEVDELKVRGARDEKDIVWVMEEISGQRPPHVNIPTSGG